jgi:hypothetical protein
MGQRRTCCWRCPLGAGADFVTGALCISVLPGRTLHCAIPRVPTRSYFSYIASVRIASASSRRPRQEVQESQKQTRPPRRDPGSSHRQKPEQHARAATVAGFRGTTHGREPPLGVAGLKASRIRTFTYYASNANENEVYADSKTLREHQVAPSGYSTQPFVSRKMRFIGNTGDNRRPHLRHLQEFRNVVGISVGVEEFGGIHHRGVLMSPDRVLQVHRGVIKDVNRP